MTDQQAKVWSIAEQELAALRTLVLECLVTGRQPVIAWDGGALGLYGFVKLTHTQGMFGISDADMACVWRLYHALAYTKPNVRIESGSSHALYLNGQTIVDFWIGRK